MTDENKTNVVEVKTECFCQSIWFKKFLTKTLAVFVGVFAALSLFAALHKPPMPPCPFKGPMMRPVMQCPYHYSHFKGPRGEFHHKKFMKDRIAPDRVKIEVKD